MEFLVRAINFPINNTHNVDINQNVVYADIINNTVYPIRQNTET